MADDLIKALDRLFTKKPVDNPPSMFVVNRFLSWRPEFAPYASVISHLKDQAMAWEVWRTALPKGKAPRLGYPAPKRTPAADGLVEALMLRTHLSRPQAEEAVDIMEAGGVLEEMQLSYGVETA